jgi:hypothetical protein
MMAVLQAMKLGIVKRKADERPRGLMPERPPPVDPEGNEPDDATRSSIGSRKR